MPITLEDYSAHTKPQAISLGILDEVTVVEEVTVAGEVSVVTGPVGHRPRVCGIAVHINKEDGAIPGKWRKQRAARVSPRRVVGAKPEPCAPSFDRIDHLMN